MKSIVSKQHGSPSNYPVDGDMFMQMLETLTEEELTDALNEALESMTNENYDFSRHTMTPLVAGCSPAGVNDWTLGGGACGFAKDGIYYYLLDTQSLEIFADHTVYIAFYEGGVPNNTIFTVADDGTISFCDDFTGVHALFTLPLDPAKADRAAAEALAKLAGIDTKQFAREMFGEETKVKFRPHHFPFTEPSAEVDVTCFKCGKKTSLICQKRNLAHSLNVCLFL